MQPTSITFAQTAFLVEVEPDFRDASPAPFVVFLSLLDDGASVLRPLVHPDGGRVVLHGQTESKAMRQAIRYLSRYFGSLVGPREPPHPREMRWGQPVVIEGELSLAS
jgi:hypothetical protein